MSNRPGSATVDTDLSDMAVPRLRFLGSAGRLRPKFDKLIEATVETTVDALSHSSLYYTLKTAVESSGLHAIPLQNWIDSSESEWLFFLPMLQLRR